MAKIEKRLAVIFLAVAMIVSFVPILGTQMAYAAGNPIQPAGNCGTKTDSDFSDNANYVYASDSGSLTISGTGEIGSRAFADYSDKANIKTIIIDEGITDINPNAFEGLTGVDSVTLPEGLQSIGAFAFYNCFKLNTITFPSTLKSIGTQAFYNDGISEIDIPSSMEELNWDAFGAEAGYGNINKVIMRSTDIEFIQPIVNKIPNSINSAGPIGGDYDYQFAWTEKIPAQAFAYLGNIDERYLSSIVLPDTITEIGESAFSGQSSLETVELPVGLKTIGWYAFYGTGLINVNLPASVTEIGREAFNSCPDLEKVTIQNSRCTIYDVYADGKAISARAVISGYSHSTAQTYAEQYERTFESLGDVVEESITTVDIGNIWTKLDPINTVPFTTEVHDELDADGVNFNDKMELGNEAWIGNSVIDKNGGSGIPKVGETYDYYVELKARDGWVFEQPAAEGELPFTLIVGGTTVSADAVSASDVSDDGKTLQLKFRGAPVAPVTVNTVDITGAAVEGIEAKTYTGKALTQSPVVKKDVNGTMIVLNKNTDYSLSYNNNVNVGTASVIIKGKGNYTGSITKTFKINKAANPLAVKAKSASVKYSKLKKKNQTLAASKVITFTKKGQGKITYTKASGNKKITINKKTGKVTVKKGLKKGTYKVKVKVKAAGNANYKASAWKTVTFKVKVK